MEDSRNLTPDDMMQVSGGKSIIDRIDYTVLTEEELEEVKTLVFEYEDAHWRVKTFKDRFWEEEEAYNKLRSRLEKLEDKYPGLLK